MNKCSICNKKDWLSNGMCKKCYHAWRYKNKPEIREHQKKKAHEWYLKNKERAKIVRKAYRDRPEIAEKYRYYKKYWYWKKINFSQNDYDKLYLKQNGKCLICGKYFEKLNVDHNHKTNKIRGLLCMPCNTFVGKLEQIELKKRAEEYIMRDLVNG